MEKKINVAELLKDCPQGMELDCTMYEDCKFLDVETEGNRYLIRITTPCGIKYLDKYGCYTTSDKAKCVIFPKGKTTWEGFVPPCKFKAGDVLVSKGGNIVLLSHIDSENIVHYHCIIPTYSSSFRIEENTSIGVGRYYDCVLANEQQRQRMYDKIKCSGYKYNQNTNKLEKLVKPNFKVGDKIEQKHSACTTILITKVGDEFYYSNTEGSVGVLPISEQDDWELVPNKFDITTLKPFDSRVLVRYNRDNKWCGSFFSHLDEDFHSHCYKFVTISGKSYPMCIPYEGNEHLLGKTDDCDEYFKNW